VARRAGVATGSVYRHFPSKADLFAEVFRRAAQREVDVLRGMADRNEPVANRLAAWVEVRDGSIVRAGYAADSTGVMGASTVRVGLWSSRMSAVALPLRRASVRSTPDRATFRQTFGGRAAIPAPRRVARPPYVQLRAPVVWTTLELQLDADGTPTSRLVGASRFPRHWVYDDDGRLAQKSGLTDFAAWYRTGAGDPSPWGGEDSPTLVSAVESALERSAASTLMLDRPTVRSFPAGTVLLRAGERGDELYLVLDGMLEVDVDGTTLGQVGPGTVLGERALLEDGVRTSTLTAATKVVVAVAPGHTVDKSRLAELAEGHHREDG
jgi:AcrR family transcriptional regulator